MIAINTIAADTIKIVEPTLPISLPANLVAAINPVIIPANAAITIIPFVRASTSNFDICFITNTNSNIDADIFNKVIPTLSISLPANCVAAIKPFIRTPRSTKAVAPVSNSSTLNPDKAFSAFDNNNNAAESSNITRTNLPRLIDSLKSISLSTAAKPIIIAESAAIAPMAPHRSGASNLDNI